MRAQRRPRALASGVFRSACSVAASYKPPMLVTRVRLPACAMLVATARVVQGGGSCFVASDAARSFLSSAG